MARRRLVTPSTRFSDNLTRLLGAHALSLTDAAAIFEVSASALTAWRAGRREPSSALLFHIAEFLEVPAELLRNGEAWQVIECAGNQERYERVETKIREARSTA